MAVVSAIIPTWNRADLLRSILTNLRAQTRPPDEIIVVDNGSTDATPLVVREFPVELVVFPENRGFAVAVNEGIRHARGDWIFIVNNDVVLEPAWLDRMLTSAEQESAAFAVGKLLRPDDPALIDGSWDLISRAAYAWRCGFERHDGSVWSTRRTISFAPMTAALFQRRVFEQIGSLETRFESYYEDVDFGVRCALAGLQGIYEPAAIALHMSKTSLGKSSARVIFLTARNQVLILAKYYPSRTLGRFAWPIAVGQFLSLCAAAKQGHLIAGLRGKWEALRLWSSFRQQSSPADERLIEAIFSESEREIHRLQRQIGFNPYWRLYFSLVRSA
ncbi:MAG: glycosyltransferase family 2 protein [Acidobacteriaceae bacterium]|nr:glycosyltransferase family 2 protein [Acidobacteriaceae bacterium]